MPPVSRSTTFNPKSIVAFEEPQLVDCGAHKLKISSSFHRLFISTSTFDDVAVTDVQLHVVHQCIEPNYFDLPPVQSLNKADFNGLHHSHAVNFIPCNQLPCCWFEIEILDG